MNIKTIKNGFNLNNIDYTFEAFEIDGNLKSYEIVSNSQMLTGTNEGLIFLDLSCSINDKFFESINDFIKAIGI